ncbi:MAG: BON domain-containing protein [Bdellovibrionales bacterium]|nr:BON domain-containing protein [Bdellovibrionales bacterium]
MKWRDYFPRYENDDHIRYAGPEYQDHFRGKGPKGYRRSDSSIYEDVCEALLNDPLVDAGELEIEVHEGVVSLRGAVEDRRMKKEAQVCIEHVAGVKDVFNLITLKEFREIGGEGLIKNQAGPEP